MNPLYQSLITNFLSKANIERNAAQIVNILEDSYPNCKLPVKKTLERLLNGTTTSPHLNSLGFLAAYILDKSETEVFEAYQDGNIKDFYRIFVEQTEQRITEIPPSVQEIEGGIKSRKHLFFALYLLSLIVLLLVGYIWFLHQKNNNQFT